MNSICVFQFVLLPSTQSIQNVRVMSKTDLSAQIKAALSNLVTLEVRTIVGETTLSPNPNNPNGPKTIVAVEGKSDTIETQINLIQGDITTAMSDKFLTDPIYAPLRKFQEEREKQGHKVVLDNIEALKGLLNLSDKVKTKTQGGDTPQTEA